MKLVVSLRCNQPKEGLIELVFDLFTFEMISLLVIDEFVSKELLNENKGVLDNLIITNAVWTLCLHHIKLC